MLNTNFTIYSLHFIYELSNNDGLILTINLSAKQVRSFTLKPQGEWGKRGKQTASTGTKVQSFRKVMQD